MYRDERIETYYDDCSIRELAEWLVDLEDRHLLLQNRAVQLKKDSDRLAALEAAGVDNWDGYSHAMSLLHGDED